MEAVYLRTWLGLEGVLAIISGHSLLDNVSILLQNEIDASLSFSVAVVEGSSDGEG